MNEIYTEPTHRSISVLALIQVGVVIGGTAFVRVMLKANGYRQDDAVYSADHYPDAARFVWQYGFAFLLVPALWVALAFHAARPSSPSWQWRGLFILAIAAILSGLFLFFFIGFATTPTGPLMPLPG